jgi:hypothetical protein
MKAKRILWVLLVSFSCSAYLFLQQAQRGEVSDVEAQSIQLLQDDPSMSNPHVIQPDVRLLQKGVKAALRLLPAS